MRAWRRRIDDKALESQAILGGAIFVVVAFTFVMVIGDQGWLSSLISSIVDATLLEVPMYIYAKRKVARPHE